MAKRRATEGTDLSKVNVKLKPFMGMQPGLYLTILYALILLLIIFLLLSLPGIRHWGSQLVVDSQPEGAAVYVDGRYVGATPETVFVDGGRHDLSVRKPFYRAVDNKLEVGGRLFGSLFAPRRERYSYQLEIDNLSGLLGYAFHDFSQWAMIDRVLPNYQLPPILHDTVAGALASTSFSDRKALWSLLRAAMGDVHNEYLLDDFMKAVSSLAGVSSVSSPEKLLATLQSELDLGKKYPDLAFWLAYSLPADQRRSFESSQTFLEAEKSYLARVQSFKESSNPGAGAAVAVDGMRFNLVPGGSYLMGAPVGKAPSSVDLGSAELPHIVTVPGYYMLDTEVTHAEYAQFLTDNPKWAPTAAAELTKAGLATSDYLKGWDTYRGPNYPQDYVSFYAAQAFCEWLQKRLPAGLAGYTVRLPNEAEWEHAARMNVATDRSVFHQTDDSLQPAGTGAANSLGIRDLLGNLWEWTSSWYFPAAYFLTSPDGGPALTAQTIGKGAEMTVRGGSWASSRDGVTYATRGSQPPDWCTPYLGFRPIIVKE